MFDEFENGILKSATEAAEGYYDAPDDGTVHMSTLEHAVQRAIDERFIHNCDLLAAVQHYGMASEAFDLVYDALFQDMFDEVYERIAGRE